MVPFLSYCVRWSRAISPPSCIGLPAMLCSPAMTALRAKYGKYLPHQRANVDQVPLPFVNDMETTYEQVGANVGGANVNFIIYYEVDDDNSKHALSLAAFGEDKEWVLLEKA